MANVAATPTGPRGTRSRRSRPEEPLERLLEQVHGAFAPAELRRGFVGLLMRAAAGALFAAAGRRLPADSRLFTLPPREAELEQRLGDERGFSERLTLATTALLELTAAKDADLPHALGAVF